MVDVAAVTSSRIAVIVLLLGACGTDKPKDPGPRPPSDFESIVRQRQDAVFDARYRLEQASEFRFGTPVPDRVARWLWEPQTDDARAHSLGYRHGWRVDYWVRPHYVGYPEQPESARMAFFADGQLRGLFAPAANDAPLELNRWSVEWVGPEWPAAKPPR